MSSPFAPSPLPFPAAPYKLYDHRAVAVATFFGSPVAGTILMAMNYSRLGNAGAGVAAVAIGVVVTALLIGLGFVIPDALSRALPVPTMFAIMYGAKSIQGSAVEEHVRQGGGLASRWAAFGIGMVFLAVILGVIFLVIYVQTPSAKVIIGTKDEVFYIGSATEQDARALGEALKEAHFFQDRGVTVDLSKGKGGTIVSFVVKEGSWNDEKTVNIFETVGRQIAPSIGGLPITVRLMNSERETKTERVVK